VKQLGEAIDANVLFNSIHPQKRVEELDKLFIVADIDVNNSEVMEAV
jgi:hypothetical protein